MLGSILLIHLCLGSLVIHSPDKLQQTIEITTFATFGNPSIYSTVGKLVGVDITSCVVSTSLDPMSFALIDVSKINGCFYEDVFMSVQSQGGSLAVLIMPDDTGHRLFVPNNALTAVQVDITGFGITHTLGEQLLKYSVNKEIWVSYNYEIAKYSTPEIEFYLTSDYTIDKVFFTNLQALNGNGTLTTDTLILGFIYTSPTSAGINTTNDCIIEGNTYCVPSDNTAKGSDKLLSTAISLNYYKSLQGAQGVTEIISYFLDLYSVCAGNYSENCTNQVIISHGSTPNPSLLILSEVLTQASVIFISFFSIDKNKIFFWPNFLADIYCSSSTTPSANCPACSSVCTASDLSLSLSSCLSSCNSSSCGYDNMNCLTISSTCYTFMLGDGNCNTECPNDPDCPSSSSVYLIIIIPAVIIGGLM